MYKKANRLSVPRNLDELLAIPQRDKYQGFNWYEASNEFDAYLERCFDLVDETDDLRVKRSSLSFLEGYLTDRLKEVLLKIKTIDEKGLESALRQFK